MPLLVVRLLLLVHGGLGDTVQVTLATLRDAAASLVLVDLEDTDLLKGLHDLAVDGAGGVNVVGGAGTTVLGRAVDLAQAADTDGLADVDVAGDGGSADVVPLLRVNNHARILWISRWSYQSASWGGSSLEAEVLTVSTQPGMGSFP